MHPNSLAVLYQPGSVSHPDNCWQAILARDNRPMGHQPANFGDQAFYGYKQRCPARVGKGGDQDIASFEIGILPDIAIDTRDFDVCVLTQVIEHFNDENQVKLLENARAVVRPGGHLVLTTPNRPISERMRFARGELQPIENWLDTTGLHALLAKTGWRAQQTSYAFNFLPVLASRLPVFRGARYLAYDVLGLRNVVEGLLESRPVGDTTVVLAVKA